MVAEPEVEEPSSDADDASRDADEPEDPVGNILYRVVWLMVFVAVPIYIVLRLTVL